MKINGNNIFLVPFADRHLHDSRYLEWLNDIEVTRYLGRDEYLKETMFADVEPYVHSIWENDRAHFFAVHKIDDDAFIGTAKVNFGDDLSKRTRSADIGIMIGDRSCWGKGIATESLSVVCRYAFDELNARKLTAGAMRDNVAMVKAFKRVGFSEEGCLRKRNLVADKYCDHILLGCFADELRQVGKQ